MLSTCAHPRASGGTPERRTAQARWRAVIQGPTGCGAGVDPVARMRGRTCSPGHAERAHPAGQPGGPSAPRRGRHHCAPVRPVATRRAPPLSWHAPGGVLGSRGVLRRRRRLHRGVRVPGPVHTMPAQGGLSPPRVGRMRAATTGPGQGVRWSSGTPRWRGRGEAAPSLARWPPGRVSRHASAAAMASRDAGNRRRLGRGGRSSSLEAGGPRARCRSDSPGAVRPLASRATGWHPWHAVLAWGHASYPLARGGS